MPAFGALRHAGSVTKRKPLDRRLSPSFRVGAATLLGVPISRLRGSDLQKPFHGARSAATDDLTSLLPRCRAYLAVAPARFAFSHLTAALLHGIPLPRNLKDGPLHVSVPAGLSHVRRVGVVGHRGLKAFRNSRAGVPVVPPEAAWLQLASEVSLYNLIVAGDYLLGGRRPLSTLDRLHAEVDQAAGQRGVGLARQALLEIRVGVRSPRETRLRLLIVRAGLPEPVVGYEVRHDGAFVGTPDLAYPDLKIAVEYEGKHHRTDEDTYEDDIVRRELFRRAGWVVFLVTDRTLARPPILLGELEALIAERS